MVNQEWTDERLNHLADQVEQISSQMGQLGQRVEQICSSVERLVTTLTGLQTPVSPTPQGPTPPPQEWLNRLSMLEVQVQQLSHRLSYLERRELTAERVAPAPENLSEEEDIDDEPDEILWDFMEPASERTVP